MDEFRRNFGPAEKDPPPKKKGRSKPRSHMTHVGQK